MRWTTLKKSLALVVALSLFLVAAVITLAETRNNEDTSDILVIGISSIPEEESVQDIPAGTPWAQVEGSLPDSLSAIRETNGEEGPAQFTLYDVTWECPDYQEGAEEGTIFIAAAVLPEGYVLAQGVQLPQIALRVSLPMEMGALAANQALSADSYIASGSMTFYVWVLDEKGNALTDPKYEPGLREDNDPGMNQSHKSLNPYGVATLILQKSATDRYIYFQYGNSNAYEDYRGATLTLKKDKTILKVNLALKNSGTTTISLIEPDSPNYPAEPMNPEDKPLQNVKTIHGRVTDSSGNGLKDVTVIAKSTAPDNGTRVTDLTDAAGNYSVKLVPAFFNTPGISAEKNGFAFTPADGYSNSFSFWDENKSYDFKANGSALPKLSAPTGLAWNSIADPPSVTAKWNASPNAAKYHIYLFKEGSDSAIQTYLDNPALSQNCWPAIHNSGAGKYTFKVVAVPGSATYDNSDFSNMGPAYEYVPTTDPDPDPNPDPDPDPSPDPDPNPNPNPTPNPTPQPTPNPPSNTVSNSSSSYSSSTSSRDKSDSTGGSSTKNSDRSGSITADKATTLAKDAAKSGKDVVVKGVKTVTQKVMSAMANANGNVKLLVDTISGGKVVGRIYIDTTKAVKNVNTEIQIDSKATRQVEKLFSQYYAAQTVVIKLGQADGYGMEVEVAAKVNPAIISGKALHFYTYDALKNTYTEIIEPKYYTDTNGFLHFFTNMGGYVVVSNIPLAK